MDGKKILVIALVVSAVLVSAGCIDAVRRGLDSFTGGECTELEEEIEEHPGMDCRCYPTDFVPEDIENRTGLEGDFVGKCYCTCTHREVDEKVNVSVVEGPGGQQIVSYV